MLSELHGFPVDRAAELLGTGLPQQAWRNHFEQLWPAIENLALPAINVPLANLVRKEFRRFMDTTFDFPHCLVHNDLGLEHVLVDEETTLPIGLIDFESAWIGDPAIDFVGLGASFGAEGLDQLIEKRDLGERLAERMWFYGWMGSVHAVIYGVREHHEEELIAGASELQRRLDARP
jgi:aminoglycoside 2''-phosphotransferase